MTVALEPDASIDEILAALDAIPTVDFEISRDSVGDNSTLEDHHHDLHHQLDGHADLRALAPVNAAHAREIRRVVLRAAYQGVRLEPAVHYTEGSLRWSGITQRIRDYGGHAPPYADCSAFVTWCYWDATRWLALGDFLNGSYWLAGYTGTLTQHGERIGTPEPGDLCFYGDLVVPYHTTIWIGNGRVVSHGRESAPEVVPVGPVTQFRRYLP